LKLYDSRLSGHAHRARLFLSLLGLEAELVPVDLRAGEQRGEAFRAINPFGTVPVLDDGGVLVRDSLAILVHLARLPVAGSSWLPRDPAVEVEIQTWLSRAARDWVEGPGYARLGTVFGAPVDVEAARQKARRLFDAVDRHLADREWLAAGYPTIADVAAYSYTALAPEGGIALDPWPAILAWKGRFEALPGFLPMPAAADVLGTAR
jgi:glutathione S-transferase